VQGQPDVVQKLANIEELSGHAAEMIQPLLAFARKGMMISAITSGRCWIDFLSALINNCAKANQKRCDFTPQIENQHG